jgi:hypothetical protein
VRPIELTIQLRGSDLALTSSARPTLDTQGWPDANVAHKKMPAGGRYPEEIKVHPMKRLLKIACWMTLLQFVFVTFAAAQGAATADLRGTVKDPNGAVVPNATITLRDEAKNISRAVTTNTEGVYAFTGMPPGLYTLTVDASGFGKLTAKDVKLTVGQQAELPLNLRVASATAEMTVSATADTIETQKTSVSTTIDETRIDNLPINERNYISFAQTQSQVNRDSGRPIGPAPTSGLNIGGQRGRSTLVQVDGADNTDNSINAARSTLGQDAVQEFQVITNSYAAEYGRASGGVINVVSKSGSNDLHGNMFGFLRHKSFQANNRFAPIDDAPYTRAQYGATLGGPIVKDKTWFFGAFEQRRRQESGFFTTDVTQGLTSSVTIPVIPGLNPNAQTFTGLTAAQATFINAAIASGVPANICGARAYAFFASVGANVGLNGLSTLNSPNDGSLCPAISPITPGVIGPRFFLTGTPVPSGTVSATTGLPIAFRPLTDLQPIFPIKEGTTYTSLRIDHRLNQNHQLTFRGGFNPSLITGIQVESQNQALGQNDFSRTGIQQFRDWSAVGGLNSTFSPSTVNEFNFNYGRRSSQFRSQNGEAVAFNISGTAFIGRELFSPVQRVEERYQIRDTFSWNKGHHLIKVGGDYNWINIDALFELNFAGLFNFGGLSASTLNAAFAGAPDFTAVQQYGLGLPSNYIQGFGNPNSTYSNKPMSFFVQDSWQVLKNLTLNYGVRYDFEYTKQITPVGFTDPLSGIALPDGAVDLAQDVLDVRQGFPLDTNNIAPRFGFSWDPMNDGKTVVRGAYGIFYDHPLLAVAFNSDIADSVQQQQLVATPGNPAPGSLLNSWQIFQGTVCPPGVISPICNGTPAGTTRGVAGSAEYQFGRQRFNDQTFPGFGTVLPFSLPVTKSFEFAYAHQANFTIEREIMKDLTISAGYLFVGARHLPRPIDINAPDNALLIENFRRITGVLPANSTQALAVPLPLAPACATPASTSCARIPGMVFVNAAGQVAVAPAVANFFRPNGPNYFLASALTGGLVSKTVLDNALFGSVRSTGALTPFGSVNAQSSTGTSNYHALNVDVKKRFSHNFQFLASYTWSHAIDDSSDLQTLLLPQDNRNLAAERADSLFDQRHRFVLSGIINSPESWRSGGGFLRALSDMTVSPIVEVSSGRPFNILTNIDTNNDQSSQTDRPNVAADGTLVRPPDFDATCVCFPAGNLGRNKGLTHGYFTMDLRIQKAFRIGERMRLDVIGEGFNLLNRFNEASASPFYTDVNAFGRQSDGHYYSRPTAAFDPRQFQFGLRLNW